MSGEGNCELEPCGTLTSFRLPTPWIVGIYLALAVGLGVVARLRWERLSLVTDASQVDGNTKRLIVTHQDSPDPELSVEHEPAGLHIEGRGLRGLQITAKMPRFEHICELDVPHRHTAVIPKDMPWVTLSAKSAYPNAHLRVSLGFWIQRLDKPIFHRLNALEDTSIGPDWQELRLPLPYSFDRRLLGTLHRLDSLLIEIKPTHQFDLWLREPRFVAVPSVPASEEAQRTETLQTSNPFAMGAAPP